MNPDFKSAFNVSETTWKFWAGNTSTVGRIDSPRIRKLLRIRVHSSHTSLTECHVYVVSTTFSDVTTFRLICRSRLGDVCTRYSFRTTRADSSDDYFVIASFVNVAIQRWAEMHIRVGIRIDILGLAICVPAIVLDYYTKAIAVCAKLNLQ